MGSNGGSGQYKAAVDTTGMDPEMKETLGGMRGIGASATPKPAAPKASGFHFPDLTKIFTFSRKSRPSTIHEKY